MIFLMFQSCEKVIDIETSFSDERLVIDAELKKNIDKNIIEATVILSKTVPYFNEEIDLIDDALVQINIQGKSIKLDFDKKKNYFFSEINVIDYDNDYILYVKHNEQIYLSTQKLLKVPKIESVAFGKRKSLIKDEVELLITFTDPQSIGDYYLWKFGPKGEGNKYDYLVARDTYINGNNFTFSFFIDQYEYFKNDDLVSTELFGITKDCYNYLNILTSQAGAQSGRPFSSANAVVKGNIYNNINPEKFPLGYFRVSEFDYFSISKKDAPDGIFN